MSAHKGSDGSIAFVLNVLAANEDNWTDGERLARFLDWCEGTNSDPRNKVTIGDFRAALTPAPTPSAPPEPQAWPPEKLRALAGDLAGSAERGDFTGCFALMDRAAAALRAAAETFTEARANERAAAEQADAWERVADENLARLEAMERERDALRARVAAGERAVEAFLAAWSTDVQSHVTPALIFAVADLRAALPPSAAPAAPTGDANTPCFPITAVGGAIYASLEEWEKDTATFIQFSTITDANGVKWEPVLTLRFEPAGTPPLAEFGRVTP